MFRYNPERLADVGRFLKLNISKEKELQEIVELAAEICGSPIAMITLMDEQTQFVKAVTGAQIEQVSYSDTFCQFTLQQKDVLVIPDAAADSRLEANPFVHGGPNLRFYAGVPLTTEKGNAIGTLCVFDTAVKQLDQVEQDMLRSLSSQVTHLLEFDVTHQILREQYEVSVEAGHTLKTYFQSSSSSHLLLDPQMRAMAFNQSMIDLLFANHQTILEEGMSIKSYIHPEFEAEFSRYFHQALQGEHVTIERKLDYEKRQICWLLNFESAFDLDGNCIGVSFNATDVTTSINNQERVIIQQNALSKIEYLQNTKIISPIDQISIKTNQLQKECSPIDVQVDEFQLLFSSIAELVQKKEKIIEVTTGVAS